MLQLLIKSKTNSSDNIQGPLKILATRDTDKSWFCAFVYLAICNLLCTLLTMPWQESSPPEQLSKSCKQKLKLPFDWHQHRHEQGYGHTYFTMNMLNQSALNCRTSLAVLNRKYGMCFCKDKNAEMNHTKCSYRFIGIIHNNSIHSILLPLNTSWGKHKQIA